MSPARLSHALGTLALAAAVVCGPPPCAGQAPPDTASFYSRSLHATNRGIAYWYEKEQGGIERITGTSATDIGCLKSKCHVASCDPCHRDEKGGSVLYTREAARRYQVCERCHPLDAQQIRDDVHFSRGMRCMDCHSAREVHGDGVAWNSCMQPGAMDTRCEKCHASLSASTSHSVHGGKLDCIACHVRDVLTCYNCHIGTRLKEKKDVQVELRGMAFLVNHDDEVTLGNFLTYVSGDRTMITFAPWFQHQVAREGRRCGECHGTAIVRQVQKGKIRPVWWEKGAVRSTPGVIPVADGLEWDLVFLDYRDGNWKPLEHPAAPLMNYSGWCSPLSREQIAKLAKTPPASGL